MAQKLLGATGIVAVLILAGILISNAGASPDLANLSLKGGILLGLIFGGLGVFGILITLFKRLM